MEKMKSIPTLRRFFEPPRLTAMELKDLTQKERMELAALAAKEMGTELVK